MTYYFGADTESHLKQRHVERKTRTKTSEREIILSLSVIKETIRIQVLEFDEPRATCLVLSSTNSTVSSRRGDNRSLQT